MDVLDNGRITSAAVGADPLIVGAHDSRAVGGGEHGSGRTGPQITDNRYGRRNGRTGGIRKAVQRAGKILATGVGNGDLPRDA